MVCLKETLIILEDDPVVMKYAVIACLLSSCEIYRESSLQSKFYNYLLPRWCGLVPRKFKSQINGCGQEATDAQWR